MNALTVCFYFWRIWSCETPVVFFIFTLTIYTFLICELFILSRIIIRVDGNYQNINYIAEKYLNKVYEEKDNVWDNFLVICIFSFV